MKADLQLAIYTHVLGVPGQYESVALMLSHKMDFNCCAHRDSFANPVTYNNNYYFSVLEVTIIDGSIIYAAYIATVWL